MIGESKAYNWRWVTYDQLLSRGPCELVSVYLVPSGESTDNHLYDGENASGDLIVTMVSTANHPRMFSPRSPAYCRRGLYIDVGTNVIGIFVEWREL